jgi:hypothetical protein
MMYVASREMTKSGTLRKLRSWDGRDVNVFPSMAQPRRSAMLHTHWNTVDVN